MYSRPQIAQALRQGAPMGGGMASGGTQMPERARMQVGNAAPAQYSQEPLGGDMKESLGNIGSAIGAKYFTKNPEMPDGQMGPPPDTNRGFGGMYDDLKGMVGKLPTGLGQMADKGGMGIEALMGMLPKNMGLMSLFK